MYRKILLFFIVIFGLLGHSRMMPSQTVVRPIDNCAAKLGYNAALIDSEMRNFTKSKLNDPMIKCMILCLWNENKIAKANGELNVTGLTAAIPTDTPERDTIVQGFTECSKLGIKDNPCDTLAQALLCFFNKPAFCRFVHLGSNCDDYSSH